MRAIDRIYLGLLGAAALTAAVLFVAFGLPTTPITLPDIGPIPVWVWVPALVAVAFVLLIGASQAYRRIHPQQAAPRTERQSVLLFVGVVVVGGIDAALRPFLHAHLDSPSGRFMALAVTACVYWMLWRIHTKIEKEAARS